MRPRHLDPFIKCGISPLVTLPRCTHDRSTDGFQPFFSLDKMTVGSTLTGPNWHVRTQYWLIWLYQLAQQLASIDRGNHHECWSGGWARRSHVTAAGCRVVMCRGDAGAPYVSHSFRVGLEIIARLDFPPAETST